MNLFKMGKLFASVLFISAFTLIACEQEPEEQEQTSTIKGEIIENEQIKIIKVYGSNYEMGYAYGSLLANEISHVIKDYIKALFGSEYYATAKTLATTEGNFNISQDMMDEMQGVIDALNDSSANVYSLDVGDLIVANCFLDIYNMLMSISSNTRNAGLGCSAYMSWGSATENAALAGESVITRHLDWHVTHALTQNIVMCIHQPDDEDKQPWISIGFAGLLGSLSGINEHMALFQNTMDDYSEAGPQLGQNYTPIWFALREAIETADYNLDGENTLLDIKDYINSNESYATPVLISALAMADTDENTALVTELAPTAPYITFRNSSFPDSIAGDNLYVANGQVARNNTYNFEDRYTAMIQAVNAEQNISAQKSWNLMHDNSSLSHNLMVIQYVPSTGEINLSVYDTQNNVPAYECTPYTYYFKELFE
jgi:hypothetical protein